MNTENAEMSAPVQPIVIPPIVPYLEKDGITIYNADCRKLIANLSFDVAIMDPPYGIDGASGTINKQRAKGEYTSDFKDDRYYVEAVVVPVVWTCRTMATAVVVTPGNKWLALYPPADSFGAFYQPAAAGLQVFGNLDAQPILYYGKNASGRNMGVTLSHKVTEPPSCKSHPCSKPINVWRKVLASVSSEGQTIIDPFMGSGTTLVAAKLEGRQAVGIEINEEYCEIAAKRLEQGTLF